MIQFDDRNLKRYARTLARDTKHGLPFAVRNSLNRIAFDARKAWQGTIRDTFILRNQWTERSIQVDKVRGGNSNIAGMQSVVGSRNPYMATQESGGVLSGKGKHGKGIPTSAASGEGKGKVPRRRQVRGKYKLGNIKIGRRPSKGFKSTRQEIAANVRMAAKAGSRYVFLDVESKGTGIYELTGGKRRPKMKRLYNLEHPSVKIKPEPTMHRTMTRMNHRFTRVARAEFLKQIKRARLFAR